MKYAISAIVCIFYCLVFITLLTSCVDGNKQSDSSLQSSGTEQQTDKQRMSTSEYYYNASRYFVDPQSKKGVLKSFDIDSFVNSYPSNDKTRFAEVESSFVNNAKLFLDEKELWGCRFVFKSNYKLFEDQDVYNIHAKLNFKNHEIKSQKDNQVDITLKDNGGGGSGNNLPKGHTTKSIIKFFKTTADCNDKEDYSGHAVFDYSIVSQVDTMVISNKNIGDTIKVGDLVFKVLDYKFNFVILERLQDDSNTSLMCRNISSDLSHELVAEEDHSWGGGLYLNEELYNFIINNKDADLEEFKKLYEDLVITDKTKKYTVLKASTNFESCFLYAEKRTDSKEMKVDYVVDASF